MTRALTRHHLQRLKQRRSHYRNAGDQSAASIGIVTTSPKVCSCWLCRNVRQDVGPTLQERKSSIGFREAIQAGQEQDL